MYVSPAQEHRCIVFFIFIGTKSQMHEMACMNVQVVGLSFDPPIGVLKDPISPLFFSVFWSSLLYSVWRYRNITICEGSQPFESIQFQFQLMVDKFFKASKPSKGILLKDSQETGWSPPGPGFLKINI